jgi:hypothetical protein
MNASVSTCCARLPLAALPVLAGLRTAPDVTVRLLDRHAWVYWPPENEDVLRRVRPVSGVELYECQEGNWYRHGHRLPTSDVPAETEAVALHGVLFPAPVQPEVGPLPALRPTTLRLVRDDHPRPTTALRCSLAALGRWADRVPTAELNAVRAARAGTTALLLGSPLPSLPGGERFWGEQVLVPLGLRAEPALRERAWKEAFGIDAEHFLLLSGHGAEAVPQAAFAPLTRSGVRLALREGR